MSDASSDTRTELPEARLLHTRNSTQFLVAPLPTTGLPSGVAFIVCNEAAERFSFYGMKAILVKFMTEHLRSASGDLDTMGDAEAREWYHWFTTATCAPAGLDTMTAGLWHSPNTHLLRASHQSSQDRRRPISDHRRPTLRL